MNTKPRNNKGQKHGLWEIYCNGELWYKCFFQNGKCLGYEENNYSRYGKLTMKRYNL
jgi:hypothetical protein